MLVRSHVDVLEEIRGADLPRIQDPETQTNQEEHLLQDGAKSGPRPPQAMFYHPLSTL